MNPQGTSVIYGGDSSGNAYITSALGEAQPQLVGLLGGGFYRWSPGGDKVAYTSWYDPSVPPAPGEGPRGVNVYDLKTGISIRVGNAPVDRAIWFPPAWTPDQQSLIYTASEPFAGTGATQIYKVEVGNQPNDSPGKLIVQMLTICQ